MGMNFAYFCIWLFYFLSIEQIDGFDQLKSTSKEVLFNGEGEIIFQ